MGLADDLRTLRNYRTPKTEKPQNLADAFCDMQALAETLRVNPPPISRGNLALAEFAIERIIAAVCNTALRVERLEAFVSGPFAFVEREFERVVRERELPTYFPAVHDSGKVRWNAPRTLRKLFVFVGEDGVVTIEQRDDGLRMESAPVLTLDDDGIAAAWTWLHDYPKAGTP